MAAPAAGSAAFPHLFAPLSLGGVIVRNRIALCATLTNFAVGNRVTDRWIDFLVERARGGAGLIISEVIAVDPEALAHGGIVTGFDATNEEGLGRAARGVAAAGGVLVGQLWHPGRQQLWAPTRLPRGVSDEPDPLSWTVPHVMDAAEIAAVVRAYVDVAARLRRVGFAGVELHGAHGYLIGQFLSPFSNRRQDEYGGSLENRIRFVLEVARGIRAACGRQFLVGLKMPADEGVAGGIDPDEAARLTIALREGFDFAYFAYSQGNFSLSLETHVPDMHFPRRPFLHLHRRLRPAAAGVPVMALGRIAEPAEAEAALADGTADLIGLSRALIADADWPAKAARGEVAAIRPATFDNIAWGFVHAGRPLTEFHNPQLGQAGESGFRHAPAPRRRRIAVIGSGPAGVQAAWVAAARGHAVTLFGRSGRIGGKLALEAALPGRGEYHRLISWWDRCLTETGVERRLGAAVDAATVLAARPEAVILATGARQRTPPGLEGAGTSLREAARDLARDPQGVVEGTAVLFDMDHSAGTYAGAEALARRFRRLVILTPRFQIAREVNWCSAIGVHRRLRRLGVEVITAAEPVRLEGQRLVWHDVLTGTERAIDGVARLVWSTPRIADDALALPLRAAGVELRLVGDCAAPRDLVCAVHEGEAAATAM